MTDFFRDIELEAANEILAAKLQPEPPPVDIETPEYVTHDEDGTPLFANRPTSAQLVGEINRTFGAQHAAADAATEQEAQERKNRGLAYQTAARCLAETHHSLTATQMAEMDKLAKQLHQAGAKMLRRKG